MIFGGASAIVACGTTGYVDGPDVEVPDTGADAAIHAMPAPTSPVVPWEPCTPGNERIILTANGSVHVLTRASCVAGYEAGVPSAMVIIGSEDGPIILLVGACNDAGAFSTWGETPGQDLNVNTDLWPDASMITGLQYGALSVANSGTITVDDWPAAGGLVTGRFNGSDLTANPPATLSGTFCVERSQ